VDEADVWVAKDDETEIIRACEIAAVNLDYDGTGTRLPPLEDYERNSRSDLPCVCVNSVTPSARRACGYAAAGRLPRMADKHTGESLRYMGPEILAACRKAAGKQDNTTEAELTIEAILPQWKQIAKWSFHTPREKARPNRMPTTSQDQQLHEFV